MVTEILPIAVRGYSTAFIAGIGILGGICAALTAQVLDWRIAYGVGGCLGLALLFARTQVKDSALFKKKKDSDVGRGNFFMLFTSWERLKRYLFTIAIGVPVWFVLGVLLAFGPEITHDMGINGTLIVGTGVMFQYVGGSMGDFLTGVLSQKLKSRNRVVAASIIATSVFISVFLLARNMAPGFYYLLYLCLGLTTGYWAVFVTIAAEQFGTNLRATVASSAPNFVRGAVIPISLTIQHFKPSIGLIPSVALVGALCIGMALFALSRLKDTYSSNLDFLET